jgi:hypothetical protein
MTELNEFVEAAAKEISALPIQGQREFVKALVSYLGGQDEIIMELIEAMLSKTQVPPHHAMDGQVFRKRYGAQSEAGG